MKKFKLVYISLTALISIQACRIGITQPKIYLPEHIKKISISPVKNLTQHNVYEERLTTKIIDEFLRDGRFPIAPTAEGDATLYCDITHYILQPLAYGPLLEVTQYKLRILLTVYLVDDTTGEKLWEEPNLEEIHIFFPETQPGGITILEATEAIYSKFSTRIVKRTIEGVGVAAGISIKEVPER